MEKENEKDQLEHSKKNTKMRKKYASIDLKKIFKNIIESKLCTFLFLFIVAIICIKFAVFPLYEKHYGTKTVIVNKASLTDVIKTSQISTYETVYNGVAKKVRKENGKDKLQYLVRYESNIKAGVDFTKIKVISVKNGKITIKLPQIELQDPSVDMQKLKFIFYDKSLNDETVSAEAYKLSVDDVKRESKDNKAIKKLANDNLKRLIKALVRPLLDENDEDYKFEFIEG